MFAALVNFELGENVTAEAVVREHAFDGVLDDELGTARTALFEGLGVVAADETRKAHVALGFFFFAGHANLVGIDHNDEITGVGMGGENGFLLTTHQIGRLDSNTAQDLIFGINDPPLALNLVRFG